MKSKRRNGYTALKTLLPKQKISNQIYDKKFNKYIPKSIVVNEDNRLLENM